MLNIWKTKSRWIVAAALALLTQAAQASFAYDPNDPPSFSVDLTINGSVVCPANSSCSQFRYLTGEFDVYGENPRDLAGVAASNGSTTVRFDFYDNPPIVTSGVLFGVISDLPGDAPGTDHAVLFMNSMLATSFVGTPWDSLFPTTPESDLIQALRCSSQDFPGPCGVQAYHAGGLFSYYFGRNHPELFFNVGDDFTAVMFSSGTVVGTGTSRIAPLAGPNPDPNGGTVPEPGSLALMAIGMVALAQVGAKRRKSRRGNAA